jgi:hypothetical protein
MKRLDTDAELVQCHIFNWKTHVHSTDSAERLLELSNVDALFKGLYNKYDNFYIESFSKSASEHAVRIIPIIKPSKYPNWQDTRFEWGRDTTFMGALIKAIANFLRFKHNE